MDMILMKIPIAVEVDRILDNRKQYDNAAKGLQKKFNAMARGEHADSEDSTVYEVNRERA